MFGGSVAVKKAKVVVLEKGYLKVKEPNFCVTLCRTVCAAYYINIKLISGDVGEAL
jgi:hypothetical protein